MLFKHALATIKSDLVPLYKMYFHREEPLAEIPAVVNNGDCGNMAAILYFVLKQKFPKIEILENENHAFIGYDGLYYDVNFSEGISLEDMNTAYNTDRSSVITIPKLFESFSYIDPVGCRFIRGFCTRWGVSIDPLYEQVITDELEYDSEEWLVQFRERESRMTETRKVL